MRPSVPVWNSAKASDRSALIGSARSRRARHRPVHRLAALGDVLGLDAVGTGTIERRVGHVLVRDRDAEAGAELHHLAVVHLLLVVGDVLALTRLADAVALDGPGQHHRRHVLGVDGALEGVVDLGRVVAAQRQLLQLLVRQVLDHLEQPRVGAPEVVAHVGAGLDRVLLVLAVDDFAHPLDQQPLVVVLEQGVPFRAPDRLDHVPAGAAEDRLELLDDLAVAAHRPVEALQVAVDHEDQVVEPLARRQGDGAQRLGLVGLAVAEERPDLGVGHRLELAVLEVAVEAGLVDGHDRPQPHRHRRELPEIGHQPRVRVAGEPAALGQLAAEVLELFLRQPAFQERAGVDARRGVALEVDHVAFVAVAAAEEMVEGHLVEGGRRGVGGDVAADAVFVAVGAHHHGHGVPADQALDAALDLAAARVGHLLVGVDGVDVGSVGGERQLDAVGVGMATQFAEQPADTGRTTGLQHVVQGFEPLPGFEGFELGGIRWGCISHESNYPFVTSCRSESLYCREPQTLKP